MNAHQYFRVHKNYYSEQAMEVIEDFKAQLIEASDTVGNDDESRETLEDELSANVDFWEAIHNLRQLEGKPFNQLKALRQLMTVIANEQQKVAENLAETISERLQRGEFEE